MDPHCFALQIVYHYYYERRRDLVEGPGITAMGRSSGNKSRTLEGTVYLRSTLEGHRGRTN